MARKFLCPMCRLVKRRTAQECRVEAEAKRRFGAVEDAERVCDPCFLKFMAEVTDVFLPEAK